MTLNNVLAFYSLAKLYKLAITSETSLAYIERCFQMVDEAPNFLHLDINTVVRILGSSELNNHSEIEVFSAAINWLEHDIEERSKYAKQLLRKVRFPLITETALEQLKDEFSSTENNVFFGFLEKAIVYKNDFIQDKSNSNCTNRYCSQNKFDVLICGGIDTKTRKSLKSVHRIDGKSLTNVKTLPPMLKER